MEHIRPGEVDENQAHLIRRYCAAAEEILHGAQDYASAVRLKESLCDHFTAECDSELVVRATSQYLDRVLNERWKLADGTKG